jgi:hypothetical protein
MLAKVMSRRYLSDPQPLFAPLSLSVMIACSFVGCGNESGPIAQEQTNLAWLGSMYARYIGANQGKPPQAIDELKKFVAGRTTPDELTRLKVASVDELFISPRDGRPFEMVTYKQLPPPEGGAPAPVVLYEAVGQNGQRAVAFPGGNTGTVSESDLTQFLPAGSRRP